MIVYKGSLKSGEVNCTAAKYQIFPPLPPVTHPAPNKIYDKTLDKYWNLHVPSSKLNDNRLGTCAHMTFGHNFIWPTDPSIHKPNIRRGHLSKSWTFQAYIPPSARQLNYRFNALFTVQCVSIHCGLLFYILNLARQSPRQNDGPMVDWTLLNMRC